jgi:hypothetical protein
MTNFRRLLAAAVLLLSGCMVDTSELKPKSDAECFALGQKACGYKCVAPTDPGTGCGEEQCMPCPANGPANTAPTCDASLACAYACTAGWEDCDGLGSNGCEVFIAGSDAANCGICGRSCLNGCASGVCVPDTSVSTFDVPRGLAVQNGVVYFADSGGAINRLASGSSVVVVGTLSSGPLGELVRGATSTELWAAGSLDTVVTAQHPFGWTLALHYVDLAATPLDPQAVDAYPPETTASYIDGLAVSASGTVAFTDSDWSDVAYLWSGGTDWVGLASAVGRPRGVVAYGGDFYFGYSDNRGTLARAADLFATEELGAEENIATSAGTPSRLAVYDGPATANPILFWASEDDGGVRAMELNGGVPVIDLVQPPTGPTSRMSIAADADGVYWSNRDLGLLTEWRASDGEIFAIGFSTAPWAVDALGTNVYWTDDYERRVYSVAK